jgi:geranylgeranyl diphosphate synthase type II
MEATKLTSAQIPKHVVQQRVRKPKENVPQTVEERTRILQFIRDYVAEFNPIPPQPLAQLKEHADRLIEMMNLDTIYRDYIGVLINNEMWREQLASVPYEKRLLLLPRCLRVEEKCPAPFDEFGLLCKTCGLCSIQDLQGEAEKLGYATLVAEGSAIVMSLIQTGKIEALVGVSCISVLERAFPYMEAAAIPGVAIPLLQDDCINTTVDLDWVWDYIHLTSDDKTRRLDLGSLREEVDFWFTPASLDLVMGSMEGQTEQIARQWLNRAGKRWRPFLAVAAYQALRDDTNEPLPDDVRKIAVAVECFHKASLIHDDIEDQDAERYGEKTLHEEYGVAVALNVGDLLIGEGYRLLASSKVSPAQITAMTKVASHGQRELCRGQGAELCWAQNPDTLSSRQVMEIFRKWRCRSDPSTPTWRNTRRARTRSKRSAKHWGLPTRSAMTSPIWEPMATPTTSKQCAPVSCSPLPTRKPRARTRMCSRRFGSGNFQPVGTLPRSRRSTPKWEPSTAPTFSWKPTRKKASAASAISRIRI